MVLEGEFVNGYYIYIWLFRISWLYLLVNLLKIKKRNF